MTLIIGNDLAQASATNMANLGELCDVPGGEFEMEAEDLDKHWEPVRHHHVKVSPFKVTKNTITNQKYGDWVKSLGANRFFLVGMDIKSGWYNVLAQGSSKEEFEDIDVTSYLPIGERLTLGGWEGLSNKMFQVVEIEHKLYENFDRPNQPATVNWWSGLVFANMHGGRLWTEAEYEFAATKGGKQKVGSASGELNHDEVYYGGTVDVDYTIDVDDPRYPDGPYGIRHLAGNVHEWCMDLEGAYPESLLVANSELRDHHRRVSHGGSYILKEFYYFHAGFRLGNHALNGFPGDGFRVVIPRPSTESSATD